MEAVTTASPQALFLASAAPCRCLGKACPSFFRPKPRRSRANLRPPSRSACGVGIVGISGKPLRIKRPCGPGALPIKIDDEVTPQNRLRGRANLGSPSRSAVGGYAVSVKAEPMEEN
jgi:hypothetical protein